MSRLSNAVSEQQENNKLRLDESVENFMGGTSYKLGALDTLKMIAASSIFGEPSYYRPDIKDGKCKINTRFVDDIFKSFYDDENGKTTSEIFTNAIDAALDEDFGATLDLAVELRKTYNMRLNPQVIMVRAAIHPKRAEWTSKNPGKFAEIEKLVMSRADEPMTQLTYYMYINDGKKNKLPTVLKKSIANKLSSLTLYQINKYKNHEIGMINAVRITHANSENLNQLMKSGDVKVSETEETWEQKRSSGKSWKEILSEIKLPHMALLRNLRNIFSEVEDEEILKNLLAQLKEGVLEGKQFPFRYESAYKVIETEYNINMKVQLLDTLEECMDISIDNLPKLKGKTMCLSDNSGSAWGCFNSEFGSETIAEIDNLSSVIAAKCSDEGYVGKFGDELIEFPITKRCGCLEKARDISQTGYKDVGGNTECGIWLFFEKAINKKIKYDNIFIFSDQQAGTGGLYGTIEEKKKYKENYSIGDSRYINTFKLIQDYRKFVNPKVNVFSVQTAGYDNVLIPSMSYRTAMLTGWTGKEILFAKKYIDEWDRIESKQ